MFKGIYGHVYRGGWLDGLKQDEDRDEEIVMMDVYKTNLDTRQM